MFKHKKILFIAPVFHGYEVIIKEKLEKFGAEVVFVPEREYSLRYKVLNNLNPSYIDRLQVDRYKHILEENNNKRFDYLFVIRGYKMPSFFLSEFRRRNPAAVLIMYQWDSNRTNPFSHHIESYDKVLSFDYKDCKDLGLQYLPLFYTDDVLEFMGRQAKYDFFFMGTYLQNRYDALMRFMNKYKRTYSICAYIYMPFTSLIKEILKGNVKTLKYISIRHMPREQYLSILSESKAIVDVSNAGQTGLAMRIIEALALRKKVVTNNWNIYGEPFYTSKSILVFDDKDPIIPDEFIDGEVNVFDGISSIDEWLSHLFKW